MQGNIIFMLLLAVASSNNVRIDTWIWVTAWVILVLRVIAITYKKSQEEL